MRIKIIKQNVSCFARYEAGKFRVGGICATGCNLDPETKNFFSENADGCITKTVKIGERFFFKATKYKDGSIQEQSENVGFLSKENKATYINVETKISGDIKYCLDGDGILITPLYPSNNFFGLNYKRCIMTSDGVLCLEPGQFIGVKDDTVEELDADEVLEILSKNKTKRSPSYQEVKFEQTKQRPVVASKGTLIYNSVSNHLEIFDGKIWRQLKYQTD